MLPVTLVKSVTTHPSSSGLEDDGRAHAGRCHDFKVNNIAPGFSGGIGRYRKKLLTGSQHLTETYPDRPYRLENSGVARRLHLLRTGRDIR